MKNRRGLSIVLSAALGSAGVTGAAMAQQGAGPVLEEVVVTSRRYEESITDAPLAVAVMDADFLRETQIDSVTDILDITPGASWQMFARAQPAFSLRGFQAGNFGNASIESAVQVVQDGIPITKVFMATATPFDLERIEVMRGPQGTTFGRNATLGIMHFISARPSQEWSSGIDVQAGSQDMVAATGFVNGSLSDTISGRLAFNYFDTHQGIEDVNTGEPLEGSENTALRGSLLIEPNDNFSAYLKAEFSQDDDLPPVRRSKGCDAPWMTTFSFRGYTSPCDPWQAEIDQSRTDWGVERDTVALMGEFVWSLANDRALTVIAGYQDGDHHSIHSPFGTPFAIRDQIVTNSGDITSFEVRLDNSASADSFRWVVGASLLSDSEHRIEENVQFPERLDNPANVPNGLCGSRTNFPGGCPEWVLFTDATTDTESSGLFGELQFDLSDSLTLALGGRYTGDSRDYDFATWGWGDVGGLRGVGLGNGARDCAANTVPDPLGRTSMGMVYRVCGSEANTMGFDGSVSNGWDDFSSKVSLSWAMNDSNTIYALYSEGFKGGGFQHDARFLEQLTDFLIDAENVANLEFGWKVATDRVRSAVTIFDMEVTNQQVSSGFPCGATGFCTLFTNAAGVQNTGLEIELAWAATQALEIGGSLASYSPEFTAGSLAGRRFNFTTGEFAGEDVAGLQPGNTPDFTYYLYGDYNWELGNGTSLRLRADINHFGARFPLDGATNQCGLNAAGTDFEYQRPDIDKIGFSATWANANDDFSVSLWGRNLDDNPDYTLFGPPFPFAFTRGAPGVDGCTVVRRPVGQTGRKQIGLTASFRF